MASKTKTSKPTKRPDRYLVNFIVSPELDQTLARLASKLGLQRSSIVRLAVNRLAEQEGIQN